MSFVDPAITALGPPTALQAPGETDHASSGKRVWMVALAVSTAVMCLLAAVWCVLVMKWLRAGGDAFVENLSPFWAWSRFVHTAPNPSQIYDFSIINAFQHQICTGYRAVKPFAYPPSFLLLLWPLGLLAVKPAYIAFLAVNLATYIAATWQRGWGRLSAGLAVVAPSTVIALAKAQDSLLVAALLFAGCRLVGRRPVVAGVLFGLMSFKPQFGLLVPIALISAREWRCIVAASATVLASVIASGAVFGWNTWTVFPTAVASLGAFVSSPGFAAYSPTMTASLRLLGAGPVIVWIGQILAAALAGTTVFWCFRRGFRPLPTAALMAGVFLTTPYAFVYDLPILTCAVLLVCREVKTEGPALRAWELVVLACVLVLPYPLLVAPVRVPYPGVIILLFFGLVVRRLWAAKHGPEQRSVASL